jgi:hypothetical protein
VSTPTPPWTLHYFDGSANGYAIESDADGASFEYTPITPAQSSTGMYSGGPPRAGRLDARAIATLWQHVADFEADPSQHVADRMKGTGAFTLKDLTGVRSFIIARTPKLLAFDAFLGSLR